MDFFGVSVTCLLRLDKLEEEGVPLEDVSCCCITLRFPAVMNGCRIAAWGLILLSGSHTRHLAMKSMNSSSLHRKT